MLPYTRGTRIPHLLGVKYYLNNYFTYKQLEELPYTRETHIPRLLGVKNYLNDYFTMYKRMIRSRIPVKLASPAYLGLGIIQIIIWPINV